MFVTCTALLYSISKVTSVKQHVAYSHRYKLSHGCTIIVPIPQLTSFSLESAEISLKLLLNHRLNTTAEVVHSYPTLFENFLKTLYTTYNRTNGNLQRRWNLIS